MTRNKNLTRSSGDLFSNIHDKLTRGQHGTSHTCHTRGQYGTSHTCRSLTETTYYSQGNESMQCFENRNPQFSWKQEENRNTEELMKIHFNKNDFWMNAITKQYAIIRKDSYLQRKRVIRSLWSAFRPAQTAQQLTAPQVLLSVSPAPADPWLLAPLMSLSAA